MRYIFTPLTVALCRGIWWFGWINDGLTGWMYYSFVYLWAWMSTLKWLFIVTSNSQGARRARLETFPNIKWMQCRLADMKSAARIDYNKLAQNVVEAPRRDGDSSGSFSLFPPMSLHLLPLRLRPSSPRSTHPYRLSPLPRVYFSFICLCRSPSCLTGLAFLNDRLSSRQASSYAREPLALEVRGREDEGRMGDGRKRKVGGGWNEERGWNEGRRDRGRKGWLKERK